ncbi:MAG: AEC family transporter [Rickettsiaceae bacterium]|nr:AEC family transporter [Rickettsiaceae bacterium]
MQDILSCVLPIFYLMLLGYFIKLFWLKTPEFWNNLETFSYYLLFPLLLFNYISTSNLSAIHLVTLVFALGLSTSLVAVGLIAIQKHYDIDGPIFTSIFQGGIRYNSYIFFGLGNSLYGVDGMEIVAFVAAYMIIFTNFLSVLAFTMYCPVSEMDVSRELSQWEIFTKNFLLNPLIIASIVGLIFNYFDLNIVTSVKNTLQSISNSASTIGLICVGAGLKFSFKKINKFAVLLSCAVKLVIMPTVTFIILKILSINGLAHSVCMLYSSLPTATNSYILSKQLGGDPDTMTSIITMSIMCSVLSLAIFTYILA